MMSGGLDFEGFGGHLLGAEAGALSGTGARYHCGDEERRNTLRLLRARHEADPGTGTELDGIDFLEVVDREMLGADGLPLAPVLGEWRQRVLLVQTFGELPADLEPAQVRITGGVRTTDTDAVFVRRLDDLHQVADSPQGELPDELRDLLSSALFDRFDRARVQVVGCAARGDFSTYHLALTNHRQLDPTALDGLDPRLASVAFSFKVECPSPLDCRPAHDCPPTAFLEPELDYRAKDFPTFRRLMLDRMAATVPDWRERHAADLGVVLVEALAYVADQLSYAQDAAVTEGYLGTARRRISVRRHARLVDYFVDEGAAARVFVALEVEAAADGAILPGPRRGPDVAQRRPGTPLVSRLPGQPSAVLTRAELEEARQRSRGLVAGAGVAGMTRRDSVIFETLHDLELRGEHNEMRLYTWSDEACCLPAGATAATLEGHFPHLRPGHLLVFEEVLGARTGDPADADPEHRHAVRLVRAVPSLDPLLSIEVTEIAWHADDAFHFPLCLSSNRESDGARIEHVSVARGNVVLADHGDTRVGEELPAVRLDDDPFGGEGSPSRFRPRLEEGPLSHCLPLPAGWDLGPLLAAMEAAGDDPNEVDPERVRPAARLVEEGQAATPAVWLDDGVRAWDPRPDLLDSGPFAEAFVAEIEDDGRARLRFGDGEHGLEPAGGVEFTATYRVGQGPSGELGADALAHVVLEPDPGIVTVRNPLPAWGARRPETLDEVRRSAPEAFRVQERAVTADDYARMAERHPEVAKAAATLRFTGSWITAFVTIDRRGGRPVTTEFEDEVEAFLGRYRLAAQDVEVDGPVYVPLDLELHVCIDSGHARSGVVRRLLARLGSGVLADGRCAFFHPDRWTFGQGVHLSAVIAEAMAVDGVESVAAARFRRWGRGDGGELASGVLAVERLEIARLDNDRSRPENGRLVISAGGGR